MQVPLLDLKPQYATMRDEIRAAIDGVCDSQYFILGGTVADFEAQVADYCGAPYAVGVTSGSDALIIALMAENIGPGDEVIAPTFTFFATAGAMVASVRGRVRRAHHMRPSIGFMAFRRTTQTGVYGTACQAAK